MQVDLSRLKWLYGTLFLLNPWIMLMCPFITHDATHTTMLLKKDEIQS